MDVQIEPSWKAALAAEFQQPYFAALVQFLKAEKAAGEVVYPPGPQLFQAFWATPLPQVRVVILGQDPYHGAGQAHGLSFSVPDGVPAPPSLINIVQELSRDLQLQLPKPPPGNLLPWARQGVLLLNATLSVRAGQAGSHQGRGWERFTDAVIRTVSREQAHVVFLLWGRFAAQKAALVDETKHLVLRAAHPSPLSAHNGFHGCGHFSQTNQWLSDRGLPPIDWGAIGTP